MMFLGVELHFLLFRDVRMCRPSLIQSRQDVDRPAYKVYTHPLCIMYSHYVLICITFMCKAIFYHSNKGATKVYVYNSLIQGHGFGTIPVILHNKGQYT